MRIGLDMMAIELRRAGYTVIAPRTITVNGFEVPEPMREYPKNGTSIYVIDIGAANGVTWQYWSEAQREKRMLERGLVHTTEAAALQHFEALIKPSRRDE